jgi:hypothetical protein
MSRGWAIDRLIQAWLYMVPTTYLELLARATRLKRKVCRTQDITGTLPFMLALFQGIFHSILLTHLSEDYNSPKSTTWRFKT